MIKRANYNLSLTRAEFKELLSILPWTGHNWGTPPNDSIKNIISKIRGQLEACQTVCSYCGLELNGTSRGEIEHIAAKATTFRHPEFTFTLKNLTLACHWCNTSEKKGTKETISKKHKLYSNCEFTIVHPYFHNPDDHYDWVDNQIEILIQVKNNSDKAIGSIDMFGLDTPKMNEHRAKHVRFEEIKEKFYLSAQNNELVNSAIKK